MMGRMARFLSDEWFALVRSALAGTVSDASGTVSDADGTVDEADPHGTISVRHRVTDGPGDVDYVVRAGAGRFSFERGAVGPIDIEILQSYDNAVAISQGRLTPAAAFAAGHLELAGDVALLARRHDELVALDHLLGARAGADDLLTWPEPTTSCWACGPTPPRTIRAAYRALARRHHPDTQHGADPATAERSRHTMAALNGAWAVDM